jgi:hypothetical protein
MRPTTEMSISCIHAIYPSAIDFCYLAKLVKKLTF